MSRSHSFNPASANPASEAGDGAEEATRQALRDLVQRRVDVRWSDFAEHHPHLAAAVDRVTLVRATVSALIDDPAFQEAISAADRDAFTLQTAERVIDLIDHAVARVLGV